MGTFNTNKIICANPALIPVIAERICSEFQNDGYDVKQDSLLSGGSDISITKGGIFKAILGTRTALKITLVPQNGNISFDAGVGIFGQQVVPTFIMLFIAWPVLITQIWGLVKQSKLDNRAYEIAEKTVAEHKSSLQYSEENTVDGDASAKFCTSCGAGISGGAHFCPYCGKQLE